MVLVDDDDSKLANNTYPTQPNRRQECHPPGRRFRSRSPFLPDYETSESQHNPHHRPLSKRISDALFMRATCLALVIYMMLTALCAVPFYFIGVHRRHSHDNWVLPRLPLLDQDGSDHSPEQIVAETNAQTCNAWQTVQDRPAFGELYSASFEQTAAPEGPFNFFSFPSTPRPGHAPAPRNINGTFELAVSSSLDTSQALLSLQIQASSIDLRDRVRVCFGYSGEGAGGSMFIYMPDALETSDRLNFTLRLILPSTVSNIDTPPFLVPSSSNRMRPPSSLLKVQTLRTHLPAFTHHLRDLTHHRDVVFGKVRIESAEAPVFVQNLQAHKVTIKTHLAEISGSFNVSESLTLDTIGAPIDVNATIWNHPTNDHPTYLSLDTGQSPINAHVTLHTPPSHEVTAASFPLRISKPGRPHRKKVRGPNFLMHMRTFGAPLNAVVQSDEEPRYHGRGAQRDATNLHLTAQNSEGPSDVAVLGPRTGWYEGTFDVQTKLANAHLELSPSPDTDNGERKVVYEHKSLARLVGRVGKLLRAHGRSPTVRGPGEGQVTVISSLADVTLRV